MWPRSIKLEEIAVEVFSEEERMTAGRLLRLTDDFDALAH